MPLPDPTRRRWYAYSLRTLFVLLTVVGVWLGMQVKWIRDRANYLKAHPQAVGLPRPTDKLASAPGLLWIFGERGVTRLVVLIPNFEAQARKADGYAPDVLAARKLFPESIIQVGEPTRRNRWMLWSTWPPGEEWEYPLRGKRPPPKPAP